MNEIDKQCSPETATAQYLDSIAAFSPGIMRHYSHTPVWGYRYTFNAQLGCMLWEETDDMFRARIVARIDETVPRRGNVCSCIECLGYEP